MKKIDSQSSVFPTSEKNLLGLIFDILFLKISNVFSSEISSSFEFLFLI